MHCLNYCWITHSSTVFALPQISLELGKQVIQHKPKLHTFQNTCINCTKIYIFILQYKTIITHPGLINTIWISERAFSALYIPSDNQQERLYWTITQQIVFPLYAPLNFHNILYYEISKYNTYALRFIKKLETQTKCDVSSQSIFINRCKSQNNRRCILLPDGILHEYKWIFITFLVFYRVYITFISHMQKKCSTLI